MRRHRDLGPAHLDRDLTRDRPAVVGPRSLVAKIDDDCDRRKLIVITRRLSELDKGLVDGGLGDISGVGHSRGPSNDDVHPGLGRQIKFYDAIAAGDARIAHLDLGGADGVLASAKEQAHQGGCGRP
jgi:hypothetical protein